MLVNCHLSALPHPEMLHTSMTEEDYSIKEKSEKGNRILSFNGLFHRNALGKIAGEIDGAAALFGGEIGQELNNHRVDHR
jgi:hypothetical protein